MRLGATKKDFNSTIGIHPTYAEVLCFLFIPKEMVSMSAIKGETDADKEGC
jgi:hypothetical protein